MAFEVGDAEDFEPGIETFAGQGALRQQRGGHHARSTHNPALSAKFLPFAQANNP